MYDENLLQIYADSFRDNWDLPAVSDYTSGETLTYGRLAERIARTHLFLRDCGVKQGDKIALLGKNTISWVVSYMATVTYGAVIVPILQDFNVQDAQHIINHSDSVMLFVSDSIWENIEFEKLHRVKVAMSLDNAKVLAEHPDNSGRAIRAIGRLRKEFARQHPEGFSPTEIDYPIMAPDSLAEINYTSGTTGFSKGVMLTHSNLVGNVVFGMRSKLHYRESRCLSFLPLAHAYGCAFDFLAQLAVGGHITLLGRIPSPKILVEAMQNVRPTIICSVPLILEKVYRKQIMPMLEKGPMSIAMKIPLLNSALYSIIRSKMMNSFGGALKVFIVGGAP